MTALLILMTIQTCVMLYFMAWVTRQLPKRDEYVSLRRWER